MYHFCILNIAVIKRRLFCLVIRLIPKDHFAGKLYFSFDMVMFLPFIWAKTKFQCLVGDTHMWRMLSTHTCHVNGILAKATHIYI